MKDHAKKMNDFYIIVDIHKAIKEWFFQNSQSDCPVIPQGLTIFKDDTDAFLHSLIHSETDTTVAEYLEAQGLDDLSTEEIIACVKSGRHPKTLKGPHGRQGAIKEHIDNINEFVKSINKELRILNRYF